MAQQQLTIRVEDHDAAAEAFGVEELHGKFRSGAASLA
jgi:hypothetical protein